MDRLGIQRQSTNLVVDLDVCCQQDKTTGPMEGRIRQPDVSQAAAAASRLA